MSLLFKAFFYACLFLSIPLLAQDKGYLELKRLFEKSLYNEAYDRANYYFDEQKK